MKCNINYENMQNLKNLEKCKKISNMLKQFTIKHAKLLRT